MADDVPIIIGSDDEDSDPDDVVLIKEEIEVEEDSDDVIFLSETKAAPAAETETKGKPELLSRSQSVPSGNLDLDRGLNRSVSITACTGQLSLDDSSQDQNGGHQCDNGRQVTTINHTSGPLDLSSKSCDNILTPGTGASDNTAANLKDNSLTLAFSNLNDDISAVALNSVKNDSSFNWLFNMDLTLSTTPSACPPVCSISDSLANRGTSADLGYSDLTVLPGGIITSTAMLPLLGSTANPGVSICSLNNPPFISSTSVINPQVAINSQTNTNGNNNNNNCLASCVNNAVLLPDTTVVKQTCLTTVVSDSETVTSNAPVVSTVDTCAGGIISGADKMDTSPPIANQDLTGTKPFLDTNLCVNSQQKPPAQLPPQPVTSVSSNTGGLTAVSLATDSNGDAAMYRGQAGTTIIKTAAVTSAVTMESQSPATPSLSSSSVVSLSTAVATPVVSVASLGGSSVTSVASSTKTSSASILSTNTSNDNNAISSNDVSSTCDPFAASHNLFSPQYKLHSPFSRHASDKNSAQSRTILQYAPPVQTTVESALNQSIATPGTSQQSQLPVNTSVESGVTKSACCSVSGLPGGSSSFVPYCVRCSTPSVPMCNHKVKTSLSPTTKKLYNPLTLPVSMQTSHMRQSLSLSALQKCSSNHQNAILKRNSYPRVSDHSHFSLPPKKQKRCYNDSRCVSCRVALEGEKSSRCPNGHMACAKCLEEKVKLVLTGKTKESVRCLDRTCDSFYPVSELKLSLPSMVVEILEDKLDQEYVDFISDMMLKNASNDMDQSGSGSSTESPEFVENKRIGILPDKWTAMDERTIQKKGYEMVKLEPDMQEYHNVVLLFFQSMVDQNVEVTSIHRVQNPIQWKYYRVKKSELQQDNEGHVQEKQLFHGTSSSVVEAICRRGFDWRVCGKHGTLYGQGSYFAVNASYSHQYTDLRQPRHMGSSMMLSNPMSMTLPTTPSLIYPPVNVNFGQPLTFLTALNLSNNAVPGSTTATGSSSTPSASTSGASVSSTTSQRLPISTRFKVVPMNSPSARSVVGHPSAPLLNTSDTMEKATAKVFLARVLVGRYVKGHAKLRKPPPLYPREDPFGKCFDSCVDDSRNPKIFVIFDSAQAYPEYLLEYTYSALTDG